MFSLPVASFHLPYNPFSFKNTRSQIVLVPSLLSYVSALLHFRLFSAFLALYIQLVMARLYWIVMNNTIFCRTKKELKSI